MPCLTSENLVSFPEHSETGAGCPRAKAPFFPLPLLFKIAAACSRPAGRREDPGLVARHTGAPDPAARCSQRLDHSVLVEGDKGQAAGEEVTRGDALQTQVSLRRRRREAAVRANVDDP